MRYAIPFTLYLVACGGGVNTGGNKLPESKPEELDKPEIELEVTALDFGHVDYGQLIPGSVTVTNLGEQDLVVESISTEAPFYVSPSNMTLQGGASGRITVNVQLVAYGAFESAVTIVSNDEDEGTLTVDLSAAAIDDVDQDGHALLAAGGDDCNDNDADVYPGADEVWYNGVDENCDGANDYDQDNDGYETDAYNADPQFGGGDCQDVNTEYHPGAPDVPYDNRDTNCLGDDDWDYDGDGYQTEQYGVGSDCDDNDAAVNRDGIEIFNGKDENCDDKIDNDSSPEVAEIVYTAAGATDHTGYAVATGDLNADGNAEIVIGSYTADTTRGTVAIFDGTSPSSDDVDYADGYISGNTNSDRIGDYVTVVGDYDGNGVNDLAIGGSNVSSGAGAVYLIDGDDSLRSRTTLADSLVTITGSSGNYLGRGIATSIDLDGDGLDELMPMYVTGGVNAVALSYGTATVNPTLSTSTVDALFLTTGTEMAFYRNAPVGTDMDGDGYEDLLFSDGMADQGFSNNGAAWILWGRSQHYGSGNGLTTNLTDVATTVLLGTSDSDYAAWCTQAGDDWDGDGDAEIWAYYQGEGLYVFEGRPRAQLTSLSTSDAAVFYDWASSSTDAEQIRQMGDWSGDGYTDMLVFFEDSSSTNGVSEVFVSDNRSGTITQKNGRVGTFEGDSDYTSGNVGFGLSPSPADIQGDGDPDLVIGDPDFNGSVGEAYVLVNRQID